MATYVNDLRLKEIGTGESSGTWGTETNVNLELIGESLGYATKALADASTGTLTIPDGTATNGEPRALYLKLTGGGQAQTVTLAPNTVSKTWIIDNGTSYALTFTQGSGANVSIAAGKSKVIATDGAGSGGAVFDCFTDLELAGAVTAATSFTAPLIEGSTSIQTPLIEYTDGDDAITIADGGGITAAAGITSTAAANAFGASSVTGALSLKNGSTSAGFAEFFEDSSNGTNKVTLIGPASTADVTVTLPASADTLVGKATTDTLTNKTLTTPTITTPVVNAGLQLKNGSTSAGFLEFFEDSGNGTNKVTLIGPASTADITLTLPSSDGDDGQALTTNGSGVLSFASSGGAYTAWAVKTGNFTASAGDQLIVNASSATTITLPASASAGDTVIIKATGGGTVTVGRNSQKINSIADDGTVLSGTAVQLVFVDSTIGFLEI